MLETPCNTSAAGTEPGSSRAGLLACIVDAYGGVRSAFPEALVLPSFGNHDTVVMEYDGGGSAAVFGGTGQMAWLYSAAADLWAIPPAIGCSAAGGDVGGEDFSCAEARRTLLLGGYFATRVPRAGLNLTVLSLNTNYWSVVSNCKNLNVRVQAPVGPRLRPSPPPHLPTSPPHHLCGFLGLLVSGSVSDPAPI